MIYEKEAEIKVFGRKKTDNLFLIFNKSSFVIRIFCV